MTKIFWIALTFLAGAFLPIQAGLNAKLGKTVESPVYTSMLSFVIGTLGLITYILITKQSMSWAGVREAPAHVWLGGMLGAFYVTVIIFAFPKLGPGLTFGLVVAGQMIISILLEHFNILVAQQNSISFMKIIGVLLVVSGVIIIRRF